MSRSVVLSRLATAAAAKWTGQPAVGRFCRVSDVQEFIHRPVDAASLGICRMLFGLVMLLDMAEERGGAHIFEKWDDSHRCHFPLLPWIVPLAAQRMCFVYAAMWLGALGIMLGFKYRLTSVIFAISYWYVFLLDRSVWNNHSYLYGLCAFLYACIPANRYCSIDAWLSGKTMPQTVPFWTYFILKYQFFVLYFVAGLKKMNAEWLSGYAMTNLSYHWVFTPFRHILGAQLTDLLVVHWCGWFIDLTIMFWLVYRPTRKWATVPCVAFHLMNSALFRIGMFPWLCLSQLPLFFERDWPRWNSHSHKQMTCRKHRRTSSKKRNIITACIGLYCALQAFLPYSHFLTPGYNTWTDGPYGYSWDMMVHAWDTVLVTTRIRDNAAGTSHYLDTRKYTASDRWSKHADMAVQLAQCVVEKAQTDDQLRHSLTSNNLSLYIDVWCSLNGRFQQRIYDPNVDILLADWQPWRRTPWIMPLLNDLMEFRSEMRDAQQIENGPGDVIFVADFPGMSAEHFVSRELENVTLTVLRGTIEHSISGSNKQSMTLRAGDSTALAVGKYHVVQTKGDQPAAYKYFFQNRTTTSVDCFDEPSTVVRSDYWTSSILFWAKLRAENYRKMLHNIALCLLQIN